MEVEYNYYDEWCKSMKQTIEEINQKRKQMTPEDLAKERRLYAERYQDVKERKDENRLYVDQVLYMDYYQKFQEYAEVARELAKKLVLNLKITFAEVTIAEGIIQFTGEALLLRKGNNDVNAKFEKLLHGAKEVAIEGRADHLVIRLYYQLGEVIVNPQK